MKSDVCSMWTVVLRYVSGVRPRAKLHISLCLDITKKLKNISVQRKEDQQNARHSGSIAELLGNAIL